MGLGALFAQSYRDAFTLVRGMWTKVLMIFALAFIAAVLGALVSIPVKTPFGNALLDAVVTVGASWLIAPAFVALYRFIRTGNGSLPPWQSDSVRWFFAWSSIVNLVIAIPTLIDALFEQIRPGTGIADPKPDMPRTWLILIVLVGIWIFVTRIVTLLPAVALGRRMTLAKAFAESRGHFWFITGALLLPMLPVIFGAFILAGIVLGVTGTAGVPLLYAVLIPAALFITLLSIAVTSLLSQKFAIAEPTDEP